MPVAGELTVLCNSEELCGFLGGEKPNLFVDEKCTLREFFNDEIQSKKTTTTTDGLGVGEINWRTLKECICSSG